MDAIKVQLFGKPKIELNGKPLTLTLKRSEAMLYFLAYEKRVTREALVQLIWCDVPLEIAKKNLRNSLYRIKKDLDVDLFTHHNKNTISIHPELEFVCDVDCGEEAFLLQYKGTFLEAFTIKDAERFENWRIEMEQHLNHKYALLGRQKVELALAEGRLDFAYEVAMTMRKIDPYDEEAVRWLMKVHHANHQYKQIVEVYGELKDLLEDDMGIKPDASTRAVYYGLIQTRLTDRTKRDTMFGRDVEYNRVATAVNTFLSNGVQKAVILEGEAGVGKTKLLEEVLEHYKNELVVFSANCYWVEEGYAYKVWNAIMGELSQYMRQTGVAVGDEVLGVVSRVFPSVMPVGESPLVENVEALRMEYLESLIYKWFSDICQTQKVLLVFDDLQWMDERSMQFLLGLMLRVKGVTFIATRRRQESDKVKAFLIQLEKYQLLQTVMLERFNEQETCLFLERIVGSDITDANKLKIYKVSEGNPFFIVEYANVYLRNDGKALGRVKNVIDARLMEISADGQKVLSLLSLFFDGVSYNLLEKIYAKTEEYLIDVLDELKAKDFIFEKESEDDVTLHFTHQTLREHIYENTPLPMRKVLHNRVGELFEQDLSGDYKDVLVLQKLMYHYTGAKNSLKKLKFTIEYLSTYFDFSHELYPEAYMGLEIQLELSPEAYFTKIDALFESLSAQSVETLKAKYLHMKSRYFIRNGDYGEGLEHLEELIKLCERLSDDVMRFKAYVQKVYYFIQTEQTDQLHEILETMSTLPKTDKQTAMFLRYQGIERMYSGDYEASRTFLQASILKFNTLEGVKRYALNIAACYNYISETYIKAHDLSMALMYVEKAIQICKDHRILRGRSVFNTNAGIIAYEMGNRAIAKAFLVEALQYFEMVDLLWRRSEAEAYLGLIEMEDGKCDVGLALIEKAKAHANKMHSPKAIQLMEMLEIKVANIREIEGRKR